MTKLVVKKIHEPILNMNLLICLGSWEKYNILRSKRFRVNPAKTEVAGKFEAFVNNKTNDEVLVVWLGKWDDGVIVHECTHAIVYLFDNRGIKINEKNDEAFCYYLEWTIQKARQLFNKTK